MKQNVVINERDNKVVLEYTGIDLTLATDIEVRVGSASTFYVIKKSTSPNIEVLDATTLSIYLGDIVVESTKQLVDVFYYDAENQNGIQITGRQVGSESRISVDNGFGTVISYESLPEFANSYVDYFEMMDYLLKRNLPVPATQSDAEALMLDAMDYLETFECDMQGTRSNRDQTLMFPRRHVYLHGWELESDVIPNQIKRAQMEVVAYSVNNTLMHSEEVSNIKSESIEGLRTEYFKGGQRTSVRLQRVMAAIKPLLKDSDTLVRV